MAKIRVSTNPLYKGGAGGYSFYVRNSEQVVRQRKNNSNYGETASRTYPQMVRRVKWSNLVNMYKVFRAWMPKAFETKNPGQTDYNAFMSLNANTVTAALTKDMSLGDNCVIEGVQISRGTLPAVGLVASPSLQAYKSDIVITEEPDSSTTVADISADILAHNPSFLEGDNIAFIKFANYKEPRVEWPVANSYYAELTLSLTDSRLLSAVPGMSGMINKTTDNYIIVPETVTNEVGATIIHTRKVSNSLAVSTQSIEMISESLITEYSGEAWVMTCIETYGLDTTVLLDPGND